MEGVAVFSLEETFDELLAQKIASPSDEAAHNALSGMLAFVQESGQVEQLMQMSMVLGAMACLHPHLEGVASEANELVAGKAASAKDHDSHDDHDGDEHTAAHDPKKCESCKKGRPHRKK